MRFITAAIIILIAGPALAAPSGSLRVIASSPEAAGLRGAQPVSDSPAPTAAPAGQPLPPPIRSKAPLAFFAANAQPPPPDLGQCRQACAHTYYFCLAGEDAASCPQNWTNCRSDCSRNSRPLP